MSLLKNIHLTCDDGLQFQLEDIAHVVRNFIDEVVVTQDKEVSALSPDVIRSLQNAYGALMNAAFSVYLFNDFKKRQDDSPA